MNAVVRPSRNAKSALRKKLAASGLNRRLTRSVSIVLCLMMMGGALVVPLSASAQKWGQRITPTETGPQRAPKHAEPPQISSGALTDQEIQASQMSAAVNAAGGRSAVGDDNPHPSLQNPDPEPEAPALDGTFEAINFNEDASLNGFFHIPPDPAGAAGPNHVVNVVNTSIEWFTKAGVRQNRQKLGFHPSTGLTGSFFASAPNPPQTNTFDPKVVYDQYANRFVVVTMEMINDPDGAGPILNQSRVYLAVSDDSDPNGTWYFNTLITEETIDPDGAGPALPRESWADFPGLAVDSEAVYFTTNMFAHPGQPGAGGFAGQRTWIMAKAPWYTGGTPVNNRYDTIAMANASPNGNDGGAVATTMQPTQMYGDTPGGVGTYLIAYSGLNDGVNLYVQVIRIDSPLSSPVFTPRFSLWGTVAANDALLGFPGGPQLGTARTIATNDRRFSQHGVFRGGSLYCAAPIRPPAAAPVDGGQVTVRWFKIDPVVIDSTSLDPPPTDQGNIGGEDIAPGTYTFFPSVAVDSLGNMAVGFAATAPTIYPGAYFAGRLAADPPGTTRGAGGLRAGRDFYVRTFNSPSAASRWGDYSGIWLDPSDELTFWVFNEYALPRGTTGIGSQPAEDGRWGNAWGSFQLATNDVTPAGAVIISEFRLSGPGGVHDEFIELYNNTNAQITVEDVNPPATGPSGWALVSSDAPLVAKAIIPTGTTIPARGHYLIANNTASTGYSQGDYPAGYTTVPGGALTTATPDRTYTTDIPLNAGIALFRSATPANWATTVDRLDAVGPATEANVIYKEGTGYPAIGAGVSGVDYSLVRRLPGGCTGSQTGGNCPTPTDIANTPTPTSSFNQDTDNNEADFLAVDTNGTNMCTSTAAFQCQRLGAPGPENLTSPIVRDMVFNIQASYPAPCVAASAAPNRVRDLTPDAPNNSTFGTIAIRRTFKNLTGQPVRRLRFRVVDISTFPNPAGVADLRARTSVDVIGITNPCGPAFTARGLTLEVDATTPNTGQPNGGGWNSSLSAGIITLAAPLSPTTGANTITVEFLFGVQANGKFRIFVNLEALP